MKFENTKVMNIDGALRGMRNPLNSWHLSDSKINPNGSVEIGDNDMRLAKTLIKSGTEHRKFLRQIFVCVDIIAPQYFMAELDTYKVGVVRDSCSIQHKGMSKEYEIDDFEVTNEVKEKYKILLETGETDNEEAKYWNNVITMLNKIRLKYLETKDYTYFRRLRKLLPMGYLYKSTFTMNYENLISMYKQRKKHKLKEWSGTDNEIEQSFVKWIMTLPYMKDFISVLENKENS